MKDGRLELDIVQLQEGQPQNGPGQYAQVIYLIKITIKAILPTLSNRTSTIHRYIPLGPHWLMGFSSAQGAAKMTKRLLKMIMDEAGITSIKP